MVFQLVFDFAVAGQSAVFIVKYSLNAVNREQCKDKEGTVSVSRSDFFYKVYAEISHKIYCKEAAAVSEFFHFDSYDGKYGKKHIYIMVCKYHYI